MEQWQIKAIAAVEAGRDAFIRDINIAADKYLEDIASGNREDWHELEAEDVIQWLWDSA